MELSDKAILKLGDLLWAIRHEAEQMERKAEYAQNGRVELLVGVGISLARIKSQTDALYSWYEAHRPDSIQPGESHENPILLG